MRAPVYTPRHRHRHPKLPEGPAGGEPPRPLALRGPAAGMTLITNAYRNSCADLQFCETCAAGRHIGPRDGAHSGTVRRVMCRYATHRRQNCAAICAISVAYVAYSGTFRLIFDERTRDRTHQNPRNRRTNPPIRRTNPGFCKRTQGTRCRTRTEKRLRVNELQPLRQ
jgi:hypothetical protein